MPRVPEPLATDASSAVRVAAAGALRTLLAGFEEADARSGGALLRDCRAELGELHAGLVTVLLRMAFLLHAEARGLLAGAPAGAAGPPALTALHASLRAGRAASREARFGAWAQVLALFRALHDGALHEGATRESTRSPCPSPCPFPRPFPRPPPSPSPSPRGGLLDPDAFPFLEGRPRGSRRAALEALSPPAVSDAAVLGVLDALGAPGGQRLDHAGLAAPQLGSVYEGVIGLRVRAAAGALHVVAGDARRRTGSHYTPPALARRMVTATLAPLLERLGPHAAPEALLELRVGDPAMGSGAFLVEVCRQLGDRVATASALTQAPPRDATSGDATSGHATLLARRRVASRCLYGVDRNPVAVELARLSLWLYTGARGEPFTFLDHALRRGDALVGLSSKQLAARALEPTAARSPPGQGPAAGQRGPRSAGAVPVPVPGALRAASDLLLEAFFSASNRREWEAARARLGGKLDALLAPGADLASTEVEARVGRLRARHGVDPFHWELEFPEVFSSEAPGFDAFVGNPPWVAHVGRAAQPLPARLFAFHLATSPAFRGYRTQHGLFIHRCASLLRPGGRLGLVVPTSVADLAGYGPTRRAHDALSRVDDELPDLGNELFEGVFQPCMALLSTRLPAVGPVATSDRAWTLARGDLDPIGHRLLERLATLPTLSPGHFGERGFQTTGDDASHLRRSAEPPAPHEVPIREGTDLGEFLARPPRHHADADVLGARLRPPAHWRAVRLLIRQTARYPIAALSDGLAFRNSILAGFGAEGFSEFALLCYLNSSPVRWYHHARNRDARQGMPQVKVGHLRALPALPERGEARERLTCIGQRVGEANVGLAAGDRAAIEAIVADALDLSEEERRCVADWSAKNPLPVRRGG